MTISRDYSPLRYPGGKGRIAKYIKLLLEENHLLDGHYVEPYAGGASVAIDLLSNEFVSEIHINDIDRAIYAFWHSVLFKTDELCKRIRDAKVTIDEWISQREIYRNPVGYPLIDIGFSAFYLNRTNRSGILGGGVIGGKSQMGKWKMGARFTKENLIKRIENIAEYKDRINLYNEDALALIKILDRKLPRRSLFYLDPPYYIKGKDLYINYYNHADHIEIANAISELSKRYWLVSYDNVDTVRKMYGNYRQIQYGISYSAAEPKIGNEVLIFSDALVVSEIQDPTSKNELVRYRRAMAG